MMEDNEKASVQDEQAHDSVESVEIAGITEPEANGGPEPTATAGEDGEGDNISEEISLRMRALDALMIAIKRLDGLMDKARDTGDDAEAAVAKVVRPMSVQIENVLPQLRDFADDLETVGEGEKADKIRKTLNDIEDLYLPKILACLDRHPVNHKPIIREE
jgi:hypothetical protein